MTPQRRWPLELTRATGRQIRKYRDELKISAQELADRMAQETGASYTRTQVTNLESGRREAITIGEVIAFARILGVAPILLVLPLGADQDVEVLPDVREDPWTAYRVFVGTLPWGALVDDPASQDARAAAYLEGSSVIDAYRDHDDALSHYLAFHTQAEREQGAANLASARDAHLNRLVRVRADMRRNDWALPTLPPVAATAVEVAEAAARRDPYAGFTLNDGQPR